MNLGLNEVNIAQTFTQLDMLKKVIPLAGFINGKLNSTFKLSGSLNDKKMTPNINTLTGDIFGQLLSTTINSSNSQMMNALSSQIKFLDVNNQVFATC